MASATEIRDRAANDLGILHLGQSLQAQDATRITSAYAEVYAQLKEDGLATWAYAGSVPDELAPYVISLVAANCLGTYAVSGERYKRIKTEELQAMREIRKFTAPYFTSQSEAADY